MENNGNDNVDKYKSEIIINVKNILITPILSYERDRKMT